MAQDIQDATTMIAHGWEPIEYRSPEPIDGRYAIIQWNGIAGVWVVLDHPTLSGNLNLGFPTAPDAMLAIVNAKPRVTP